MAVMTRVEISSAQLEYVWLAPSSVPLLSATATRNLLVTVLPRASPSGSALHVSTETIYPTETLLSP